MARIRTIKPEFWDSGDTASASLRARLLYIAMWNWADDYGIGDASPIRLIGFAFPNDEIAVSDYPRLLAEVSDCFSVMFFNYEKRPYYYIPEWEKHQRTEKRAKQRIPYPDAATSQSYREFLGGGGFSAESVGSSGAGTGEQGNRGTGEEVNTPSKPPASRPTPNRFDEFWDWYPRKVGKADALKAWKKATAKTDPQVILDGVERYRLDPNLPEKEFIPHAATWLSGGRWEDEPLPARNVVQMRPTGAQQRLQAGFDLLQQTRAEMDRPLEIEGWQ